MAGNGLLDSGGGGGGGVEEQHLPAFCKTCNHANAPGSYWCIKPGCMGRDRAQVTSHGPRVMGHKSWVRFTMWVLSCVGQLPCVDSHLLFLCRHFPQNPV